jgi:hypothetical protein
MSKSRFSAAKTQPKFVDSSMNSKGLRVLAIVPLSTCSCCYQDFLDRAFAAVLPYKASLDFSVKDVNSPEGDEYGIFQNSIVIVDEGQKFTSIDAFKSYLESKFAPDIA